MNQTLQITQHKIKHNESNIGNQPLQLNIINLTTNQTLKMKLVAAVLVCSLHRSRGEDSCFSFMHAHLSHAPKRYLP